MERVTVCGVLYLQNAAPEVVHQGVETLRVDVLLQRCAVSGEEGDEWVESLLDPALPELQLQQQRESRPEELVHLRERGGAATASSQLRTFTHIHCNSVCESTCTV